MRVVVVTESWRPATNGVVRSVEQVLTHLHGAAVEFHLVAPGATPTDRAAWGVTSVHAAPAVPLAGLGYSASAPTPGLTRYLQQVSPDVVHVASPFLLGAQALRAAQRLGLPSVAVYQTDVAAFAAAHGFRGAQDAVWRWIAATHRRADRTLACTQDAADALRRRGVPRVHRWQRGVDLERFESGARSEALREQWSPRGLPIVGYVGRLAPEKELELLAPLAADPGLRLVLVGDGPLRESLARQLPGAVLTGHLEGAELAAAMASLDVVVHPGRHETLCQSVMQAMACGVPAVVPDAGGVRELVPATAGRRFAPGDAPGLARAVAEVLAERARLAAGAAAVSTRRGMDVSMAQLLRHWYGAATDAAAASDAAVASDASATSPAAVAA